MTGGVEQAVNAKDRAKNIFCMGLDTLKCDIMKDLINGALRGMCGAL